jgi:hypothetical protein
MKTTQYYLIPNIDNFTELDYKVMALTCAKEEK